MESNIIHLSLDLSSFSGIILSPEQKAALQKSMVILKRDYKFNRILFWGRILGTKADYFIVKGLGSDELKSKAFLYSFNCLDWFLLPQATREIITSSYAIKGRFIGDPSYVYIYVETEIVGEGEDAQEEELTVQVTEEYRLVAVTAQIETEAAVVPRGAYIKNAYGQVNTNRRFEGLSMTEAKKLNSYFHFAEPVHLKKKTLLEKADLEPSIDFLDSLEDDLPSGSWSLQFEKGNSVVVLRSLLWLGLTFYHIPLTSHHGYTYIGTGQKNIDFPFML
ncbi:radial spoke head protein 9 homolog [Polypterus senegalus]|uniref:radial spoke head protein 9 homolog n=1 Tax=Polypterus senegalus TaxID=55291 RepID=UPI0019625E71|nr:radial spoke head protein 9 homolog [Polypterus senegalus]